MPKELTRFVSFIGVGGIATAIQYGLLILLVEWFSIFAVTASVIAYAISAIFNYAANYYVTFNGGNNSANSHQVAVIKFVGMVLVAITLTYLLMQLLIENFAVPYLIAQLIVTGVVLVFNYLVSKFWVFKSV